MTKENAYYIRELINKIETIRRSIFVNDRIIIGTPENNVRDEIKKELFERNKKLRTELDVLEKELENL